MKSKTAKTIISAGCSDDCPRCGKHMQVPRKALSRLDNETYVCPDCGIDEAIEAYMNNGLITNWKEGK